MPDTHLPKSGHPAISAETTAAPVLKPFTGAEEQELKEAVCDVMVEQTRQMVSGEGEYGQVLYRTLPSKLLTSGFLMPKLSPGLMDESSPIAIANHGLDFRILRQAEGELVLQPSFSVYVRVLPEAEEVFNKRLGLKPKPRLNKDTEQRLAAEVKKRLQLALDAAGDAAKEKGYKSALRAQLRRDILQEWGVAFPARQTLRPNFVEAQEQAEEQGLTGAAEQSEDNEDGITEAPEVDDLEEDWRIPNPMATQTEIPEKYLRLPVAVEPLRLPLPFDAKLWGELSDGYTAVLEEAIAKAYADWLEAEGQQMAWRPVRPPSEAYWRRKDWESFLVEVRKRPADIKELNPEMQARLVVDAFPDLLNPDTISVRAVLENHQRSSSTKRENGLFQTSLAVFVPSAAMAYMPMERVKRSYHLSGFLRVPAVGVNGGVTHRVTEDGHWLETTWAPRFVLPRMQPTRNASVPTAYSKLSEKSQDIRKLESLPDAMQAWLKQVSEEGIPVDPDDGIATPEEAERQRSRFLNDQDAWSREAERIRTGVKLLTESQDAFRDDPDSELAIPYKAWLLMQLTFSRANRPQPNKDLPGWRLFQLAFILCLVPTFASKVPGFEHFFDREYDEECATLLYMSAGGGKSEAFYAIIVYCLFLDRLRGKKRGVTAMLRYPLRLLTVQQAQRFSLLLAQAELIRRHPKVNLGGAPFELGFWVGGGNTPNRNTASDGEPLVELKPIPLINKVPVGEELSFRAGNTAANASYVANLESWNKLKSCPFCNGQTGLRIYPEQDNRLGIVCDSGVEACEWNRAHRHQQYREPLPFVLTDSDIMHRAPSILLGTVDKLATIGQHPNTITRLSGIFGLARWIEGDDATGMLHTPLRHEGLAKIPSGVRTLYPAYEDGEKLFFDPLPSIIVQDELHLLEESLGTFAGIFETTLEAWLREIAKLHGDMAVKIPGSSAPRMPHVIGATATAADVERQMGALYGKKVIQFPHPGPTLYRSFYTEVAEFQPGTDAYAERTAAARNVRDEEALAPWGRIYVSLLTNGRPHTATSVEVLAAYAAGLTRLARDLTAKDPARQRGAVERMLQSLSPSRMRHRHEAILRRCLNEGRFLEIAKKVDLHRIQLSYVTNKKGGDQLMSALEREVAKVHAGLGEVYEIGRFETELISGGVDIKDIQMVMKRAEVQWDIPNEDISALLRTIVATSAISHGVDVEFFNAMDFIGMPSDITEYIQASARVGRTHVGFSMLIPTPQTRRDRFIVENHEVFHRFLERMIAPPAVERWADRAIERTIPSLFQTYFVGVLSQQAFLEAESSEKGSAPFYNNMGTVRWMLKSRHGDGVKRDCIRFIKEAIGLSSVVGPMDGGQYYQNLVETRLNELFQLIGSQNLEADFPDFWPLKELHGLPAPMMSLRDIDEAGRISEQRKTFTEGEISYADFASAMAFLRNHKAAGKTRKSAHSEADADSSGREW